MNCEWVYCEQIKQPLVSVSWCGPASPNPDTFMWVEILGTRWSILLHVTRLFSMQTWFQSYNHKPIEPAIAVHSSHCRFYCINNKMASFDWSESSGSRSCLASQREITSGSLRQTVWPWFLLSCFFSFHETSRIRRENLSCRRGRCDRSSQNITHSHIHIYSSFTPTHH